MEGRFILRVVDMFIILTVVIMSQYKHMLKFIKLGTINIQCIVYCWSVVSEESYNKHRLWEGGF